MGDALGSVRQLTDVDGAVVFSQSYQPYGEVLSSVGSKLTDYGFTGEWMDGYIKLIYLRSRYYAPETGRFLTRDTWRGDYTTPMSYNRWLYAYANPVKYVDPTGYYNRLAAIQYAKQFMKSNPSPYFYNDFSFLGSTCTSFASSVLWEGGIQDLRTDPFVKAGFDGPAYDVFISYDDRILAMEGLYPDGTTKREEKLIDTDPDYWHKEYTWGSHPLGDSYPLGQETWFRTDELLRFLESSEATGTAGEMLNEYAINGNIFDNAWLSYLESNKSRIQPGDLVFYRFTPRVYPQYNWDHIAVVIGWGSPTFYPLPPLTNDCKYFGVEKPRVVEQSSSPLLPYDINGRSIDNTYTMIETIAIFHITQ